MTIGHKSILDQLYQEKFNIEEEIAKLNDLLEEQGELLRETLTSIRKEEESEEEYYNLRKV